MSVRVVEVEPYKDKSLIDKLGGYDQAVWFQKHMIIAESNGIKWHQTK